MRKQLVVISGILALILVNLSIVGKERLLTEGRLVYLELAPVDPRSLMQGDYMALNYKIANDIRGSEAPNNRDGFIVAKLDERSVAAYQKLADGTPLAPDQIALHFRLREGQVKFATNAYFFQEGQAQVYALARYGAFRVAENGDMLLVSLHDQNLTRLGPQG
jgi:uncharacterized membrane-anchored protein